MKALSRMVKLFSLLALAGLLVAGWPPGSSLAAPLANPDHFGYQWASYPPDTYPWIDATDGTKILSLDIFDEDSGMGPYSLGFDFKFYENAYPNTQPRLYVHANGLVGFNSSVLDPSQRLLVNTIIPFDFEHPQNYVAPYWDDLRDFSGKPDAGVYYETGFDATYNQKYAAIQWNKVSSYATSPFTMTFEVVLFESGNILFQYQDLHGIWDDGTAGVENSDGLDGLQVFFNQPVTGNDIYITRPPAGKHIQVQPLKQSAFNIRGESAFKLKLRNANDDGSSDAYQLELDPGASGWSLAAFDVTGSTPLLDPDLDGKFETQSLAPGQTLELTFKLRAPQGAGVGAEATGVVTVTTDVASSAIPAVAELRAAVPAPFAQTYSETRPGFNLGIMAQFFAPNDTSLQLSEDEPSGGSFGINILGAPNYINFWQKAKTTPPPNPPTDYTDIEYIILDDFGRIILPKQLLTDNATTTIDDTNPVAVVSSSNGNIGVAWIRVENCGLERLKYNIYLSILDPSGTAKILDGLNVTQDTRCTGAQLDPDKMNLNTLRITEAGGNFHLTWVEHHFFQTFAVSSDDIGYAVYSAGGSPIPIRQAGFIFPFNETDDLEYYRPAISTVNVLILGQKVMVAYFHDSGNPTELRYVLCDTDGDPCSAQTPLNTGNGSEIDIAQLTDGKVVVGWSDSDYQGISFMVLGQDLSIAVPYTNLIKPDGRNAEAVSVSAAPGGYAVLTWMDSQWHERLYYALVNGAGIVTQPMTFLYAATDGSFSLHPGYGNAAFTPRYRVMMPLIRKP